MPHAGSFKISEARRTGPTSEIIQANNFAAPCVVSNANGNWTLAKASALSTSDIWLCVEATPSSFKIASSYEIYSLPAHGLGSTNEVLKLSATTDGVITTADPTSGQYRVLLGTVFDANNILWAPNLRVEKVA